MEKETLALLLAIVADIDAGGDLLRNDSLQGGMARPRDFAGVDGFAAHVPSVQFRQFRRPRQAAGMSGENTVVAAFHVQALIEGLA